MQQPGAGVCKTLGLMQSLHIQTWPQKTADRLVAAMQVQVIEGLEETRTQLVFVTEAVFCSLGNLLSGFQGLPAQVRPRSQFSLAAPTVLCLASDLTGTPWLLVACQQVHGGMQGTLVCPCRHSSNW